MSDPAKPVPYINYVAIGMTREHMVDDQRFASMRPDVLVYQTGSAGGGRDIFGADLGARLQVSAERDRFRFYREADRCVLRRLSESRRPRGGGAESSTPLPVVHPPLEMGGYQQMVRGEAMRGEVSANSYSEAGGVRAWQAAKVRLDDAGCESHISGRGHRIMIQVQSVVVPVGGSESAEVLQHLSG